MVPAEIEEVNPSKWNRHHKSLLVFVLVCVVITIAIGRSQSMWWIPVEEAGFVCRSRVAKHESLDATTCRLPLCIKLCGFVWQKMKQIAKAPVTLVFQWKPFIGQKLPSVWHLERY